MNEETKFHWAEGMKYALEGIKTLFILNGASAVSILTFIGNIKNDSAQSEQLVYAMFCFALGAATGPVAFFLAYETQLNYGNSRRDPSDTEKSWTKGRNWHSWGTGLFVIGVVLFLVGIALAGCAFKQAI